VSGSTIWTHACSSMVAIAARIGVVCRTVMA
jgi:hypothetical protein